MRYSKEYIEQLNKLHERKNSFGQYKPEALFEVQEWINHYKPRSFIDYGCGKGGLVNRLNDMFPNSCVGYDPGHPDWVEEPKKPAEMLTSTDVLEHIEPEHLTDVLKHIDSLFTKVAFLLIATCPAKKNLPDGRNAHLIQEEPEWWKPKLLENINANIVSEVYKKETWRNKKTGADLPNNKYIVVMEKYQG